jgi:hypothetical protein
MQTLPTLAEQQIINLQGNTKTGLDLRYRVMGMRLTIKYSQNPEIPIQNFKAHNKCTMVR